MKDHRSSRFQSSKVNIGAVSHIYMSKTSIISRIKIFCKGPLIIFPLYGQIQGEVVVGTSIRQAQSHTFLTFEKLAICRKNLYDSFYKECFISGLKEEVRSYAIMKHLTT